MLWLGYVYVIVMSWLCHGYVIVVLIEFCFIPAITRPSSKPLHAWFVTAWKALDCLKHNSSNLQFNCLYKIMRYSCQKNPWSSYYDLVFNPGDIEFRMLAEPSPLLPCATLVLCHSCHEPPCPADYLVLRIFTLVSLDHDRTICCRGIHHDISWALDGQTNIIFLPRSFHNDALNRVTSLARRHALLLDQ